MQTKTENIINIRKLKKDGSISNDILSLIVDSLTRRELVLMPVDSIYAIVGIADSEIELKISKAIGKQKKRFQRLLSSFRMLDDLALISKSDYDFLNRVWPGEITVILKKKTGDRAPDTIAVRYPRSKFLMEIISRVEYPLIFSNLYRGISKFPLYKKSDILKNFKGKVDLIFIVDELCRKHPRSTLVDISNSCLRVVRSGKIPGDEVKSLYFLGKDDECEF